MARPKVARTPISLRLRDDALAALDRRATAAGLSRTQLVEALALGVHATGTASPTGAHGATSGLAGVSGHASVPPPARGEVTPIWKPKAGKR